METRVTNIGNRYHARLFSDDGQVLDEMACVLKSDIGWICREMLRWQDKLGNYNEQTRFARKKHVVAPVGRVWYRNQLGDST